jgi:glutamyl-tRNA synthetase
MLGWNDGTDQEIFTLDELVDKFSIDRVSKAGAKFDFEKAKWYNAEWIKKISAERLAAEVKTALTAKGITVTDDAYLNKATELVKDRLVLISDIYEHAWYFFKQPEEYDLNAVKPKWTDAKTTLFQEYIQQLQATESWDAAELETNFKAMLTEKGFKIGDAMLPFRIMLVGGKFGPHVFDIAALLGKQEVITRIEKALAAFTA